jgi:hypothetical protein
MTVSSMERSRGPIGCLNTDRQCNEAAQGVTRRVRYALCKQEAIYTSRRLLTKRIIQLSSPHPQTSTSRAELNDQPKHHITTSVATTTNTTTIMTSVAPLATFTSSLTSSTSISTSASPLSTPFYNPNCSPNSIPSYPDNNITAPYCAVSWYLAIPNLASCCDPGAQIQTVSNCTQYCERADGSAGEFKRCLDKVAPLMNSSTGYSFTLCNIGESTSGAGGLARGQVGFMGWFVGILALAAGSGALGV